MLEDILYFALCAHCKEELSRWERIARWNRIASKISEIVKKEVKITILSDLSKDYLNKQGYAFYYANPDVTFSLIEKGYIVLGKLKDENESLYTIFSKSYSSEKEIVRVALINQKYFFLPLLLYKKDQKKFNIIFADNYDEVISLVRQQQADMGFVYSEFSERLKHDKTLNFSDDFCFPIYHFILMHPSLEKFQEELLSIKDIDRVSPEEIENIKTLYNQLDVMLQNWAHYDISEALISSPIMGVLIYHEKILFCNEYMKSLLGYSEDEIYNMRSIDIVYPEDRQKIIGSIKRRLKGEKFSRIYDIRLQRKDGSVVFVECFASTILFRGLYSGFVVFYDITNRKLEERSKQILIEINKIITNSLTEEEIYLSICKCLVEVFKFKFAWIGIVDEQGNEIIPKYKYGNDEDLLTVLDFKIMKGDTLTEKALFEGEISINEDLRVYSQKQPCAQELIKRGFLSSCTIPLFKYGKVVSLLKIYSEIPYSLNMSMIHILKEIQNQISFALERIERIKNNTIISEALRNSDTWILVTDENGNILYVNEAVEKISGYSKEELIGKNPRIFKSGLNPPEFYKEMWDTILSGKIFNAITPNRKKNGEIFHVDLKIIPLKLPGDIIRFIAVAKDVTTEIMLSERLQKLQNFDALTGLFNINGFAANVTQKLERAEGIGLLILMDIYNMSNINKVYGINKGDLFLIKFAEKLKEIFENAEALARIGADTFGIYIHLQDFDEIYKVVSKLYQFNKLSIRLDGELIPVFINASIAMYPRDGEDFKSLFERADIALQKAKKTEPGTIIFFNPEIEKEISKIWEVFTLIKKAVDGKLFKFYYQPYFNSQTLEIAGFEALIRIVDNNGKVYTPNIFIDYLENSHYLREVETWALKEVIEKIKKWNKNISVNISGKNFMSPVFPTLIQAIPSEIREKLVIEITERIFIENTQFTMEVIKDIKSMYKPPKIAIDDFGTGYSSMIYLKDLPIDIIKIDRSFIKDMSNDKKSLAIVMTMLDLGKRLDVLTLAEGVELEEQYNLLKVAGCDYVQGYLFAKPLPEEEIENEN